MVSNIPGRHFNTSRPCCPQHTRQTNHEVTPSLPSNSRTSISSTRILLQKVVTLSLSAANINNTSTLCQLEQLYRKPPMDPPRDPNQRAHGQVWSDGTFLHQTRARTQGAQASPSRQAEPQQGTNRARRAGRSHKRKHRDLSPDSRQEESPNTNDARFPPPQSSSHGILGARIRRPSIASQDAFFARHFDYDDPNSRNAEEPAWKEQLDEFNLDLEDDQTQSIITDAQMLPKIPVAQMLPIFYQANTNDTVDAELHQSFDSLFDSPPAKKTRCVFKREVYTLEFYRQYQVPTVRLYLEIGD